MAKILLIFLGVVFLQAICVIAQTTPGTTTTTASPRYMNCVANCPATSQYSPVCGTDMVSYYNIQRLRCAQQCGLRVRVLHTGTCQPSAGGK